ncbi:MAG: hypothetical protein PHI31_13960 [Desulfuromonadaceae bacterium]|nr:hypothetical protein [Desulfuromonadaceae bacterium]
MDNPHIITLLYRGGIIISSKKTSYSDILKIENLEIVVEELMKEQHKEMMRRLKAGEFDEKAFSIKAQLIENYKIPTLEPEADKIADIFAPSTPSHSAVKGDVSLLFELTPPSEIVELPLKDEKNKASDAKGPVVNLDEAILSFFGSREK